MDTKKGIFIVIEGMDGSGKTTLIDNLKNQLLDNGQEYFYTKTIRNKSSGGAAIRDVLNYDNDLYIHPRQLGCLFIAELFLVWRDIQIKIDQGINVICDRWWYSTLAYAGHFRNDMDALYNMVHGAIREPDILIYLNIEPTEAIKRVRQREGVREIYDDITSLYKIDSMYKKILSTKINPSVSVVTLDANLTSLSVTDSAINIITKGI